MKAHADRSLPRKLVSVHVQPTKLLRGRVELPKSTPDSSLPAKIDSVTWTSRSEHPDRVAKSTST